MNKLLITVILFLLALTVVANDQLKSLLEKIPLDLTAGIEHPAEPNITDFTKAVASPIPAQTRMPDTYLEPVDGSFTGWYRYDFAETPFDGRLEMLVVGEPLPTPLTTLLVAIGTVGILYMSNRKSSKQDKTLVA